MSSARLEIIKRMNMPGVPAISCASLFGANEKQYTPSPRTNLNFNSFWAFHLEDVEGGEKIVFDDRGWVPVTIPHTLALDKKHFDRYNYKGIGWYRRYFVLDRKYAGKRINIDFEGVMIDGDVYLNGEKLATRNGGYIGFSVDISDKVKFGQNNVLAVRVSSKDNPDTPPGKPEFKLDFHYYGGIYRNVSMRIQDPLHITDALQADQAAGGGVFATTPKAAAEEALVHVKTHVSNARSASAAFTLRTSIVDAGGKTVAESSSAATTLEAGKSQHMEQDIAVKEPKLWHPDHPDLYTLVSEVVDSGKVVDVQKTKIGIRRIEFKADGFYINGEKLYLRGANRHQQFQNVGCAAPGSIQRLDAVLMKQDGFNAVRAAHYPNDSSFLDACDEIGLLVIECQPGWQNFTKTKTFWDNTIRDCREMIRRDRNHPSLVLWEASLNETPCPEDWKKEVTAAAHAEYPGDQLYISDDGAKPNYNVGYKVVYRRKIMEDRDPNKPFLTREWGDWEGKSKSLRSGGEIEMLQQVVYHQVYLNGDGYDDWGGLESCERIAGVIKWAWMDHTRGMSERTAGCGAVDINRYPKFSHFWLKSMMDARNPEYGPMVYIADYNMPRGEARDLTFSSKYHGREGSWTVPWSNMNVMVFSNCDSVRLYQNGTLIGTETREKNAATAPNIAKRGGSPYFVFTLKSWQAGTLKAEGIMDGKVVSTHEAVTPEQPAQIVIEPADQGLPFVADGSDLAGVYFKIVDKNGTLVPTAANPIRISVSGEGKLVGAGLPRLQVEEQEVEAGLGFAYVRSTGKPGRISIRAESQGLKTGEKELSTVAATCQFVPDGKHAAWTRDERIFESAVVANQAASREVDSLGNPISKDAVESITASCPSAAGRGTDKLLDGITDFGTGWLADTEKLPQFLTVKFKRPTDLSAVQIDWEKDSTWYTYDLETSADGNAWNKVADSKSVTGHEKAPVKFKKAPVGFLRITIKDVRTGAAAVVNGIAEIKFY
jgi:hypothetical protein